MKIKSALATMFAVLSFAVIAHATTIVTPPVGTSGAKVIYCMVQNVDTTTVVVTSKMTNVPGNTVKSSTYQVPPGQFFSTLYLDYQNFVSCSFTFEKGKKIRGYITVVSSNDTELISEGH